MNRRRCQCHAEVLEIVIESCQIMSWQCHGIPHVKLSILLCHGMVPDYGMQIKCQTPAKSRHQKCQINPRSPLFGFIINAKDFEIRSI